MKTNTNEALEQAFSLSPKLRNEAVAALDSEISRLQVLRASLAGENTTKRSRRGKTATATSANTSGLTHPEAIMKALKGKKDGLTSRQIREEARNFGHEFGKSLGTTLNNMCTSERLGYKPVEKDSKQYLYTAP